MQTDQNRIALIPAYQPERTLAELAEALHQAGLQVWIVDDGSGEEYRPVFEAAAGFGTVIYTPVNRGKGAALKTGLAAIAQAAQPPYTVVTVDADGQHRPADVLRVLEEAAARPKALVLGSRDFRGKVPLRSRLGNSLTRLVFRLSTGRRIYDTQTGLRAFSHLQLPLLLDIDGDRYEYEMNVLKEYARAGLELREVPIETVYLEGNRSSHFHPLRDSFRIYRQLLGFSASSLLCFGLDYGLFCLLSAVTGSVPWANVGARLASASVNYQINRRLVFRSGSGKARPALRYAALALGILVCNTLLLSLLTGLLGMNRFWAKLLTEALLFLVSFTVQRTLIFAGKGAARDAS